MPKIRKKAITADGRVACGKKKLHATGGSRIMNKFTTCILAAALMMVPFSAFAMDIIPDRELEAVTGQAGVSISVIDLHLEINIMNVAWGDTDCGTIVLSTLRHSYTPGYVNLNNFGFDAYFDMDTGTMGVATDNAGGTYYSFAAHPITIDVMTFSSNGPHCPSQALRGKTAVVIGIPDLYISVLKEDSADDKGLSIYLDDHAYTVQTAEFTSMQKWNYTTGPLDESKKLGVMHISGIQLTTHAYVGGYETFNATPGGELKPINPNHRALLLIWAH
jgi:hypothetical protein